MLVETEQPRGAVPATALRLSIRCRGNPGFESRPQDLLDRRRRADATILPGEIIIPAAPAGLVFVESRLLARQAEIADRDGVLAGSGGATLIGEGVELFDITERQPCLPLDPGPQSRLPPTMDECERPG